MIRSLWTWDIYVNKSPDRIISLILIFIKNLWSCPLEEMKHSSATFWISGMPERGNVSYEKSKCLKSLAEM